ncbi:hypothetical protein GCM10027347_59170 [Larkinella harenae]
MSVRIKLIIALAIGITIFLLYRIYDIGGDRREKAVRIEWALADAAKDKAAETQRLAEQAASDEIHTRKMAEREEIIRRNMDADFKKRLRDERAKAAYAAVIPADGVQLYNEAIRGAASASKSSPNRADAR